MRSPPSRPDKIRATDDDQYDERAFEVERDSKLTAWQVSVSGPKCTTADAGATTGLCARDGGEGWTSYSVERFYSAPLVYNVSCVGTELRFSTVNNFKQSNTYAGKASIFR